MRIYDSLIKTENGTEEVLLAWLYTEKEINAYNDERYDDLFLLEDYCDDDIYYYFIGDSEKPYKNMVMDDFVILELGLWSAKYAVQLSYYHWNSETNEEYEKWVYVGTEGEHKIFVMDDEVTDRTKLFDTASEAGAYIDKYFYDDDEKRCCYSTVRIIEVRGE